MKRPIGHRVTFEPDGQARGVHHHEHVFEAPVGFANEITDSALVVSKCKHARGTRVDPELVLDRNTANLVALAERTVVLHQPLRYEK